jgi:ATP-binding cassette subfamily B protein
VSEVLQQAAAKARKGVAQLPHIGRALRLVFRAAPRTTVLWMALLVVQGLLPVAIVYLTRDLVDSLVAAVHAGAGVAGAGRTLLLAGLMAGALLATELLRAALRWVRTAEAEVVRDKIAGLLHEKAAAADLAYYESPEYFDKLYYIHWDVQHRPVALMENVGGLVQNLLTLAAMVAVLLRFGIVIPLALLLSTLPALAAVVRYAIREHAWRVRATPEDRRAAYFDWLLTSREAAAEMRLFSLGEHFRARFQEVRARLRRERLQLARAEGRTGLIAGGSGLVVTGAALGWMVWRALQRLVTLGEVAMFYQAFSQGQQLMRSLLDNVGQIYGNSLFLENLFAFLELEPGVRDPEQPHPPPPTPAVGLRFRGVTFAYPGAARPALAEFDLDVPAGQVLAVVGANGAGKSTLIKLACRFYDPQRGSIEVGGVDVRELRQEELRRLFTVLFQEPVHFNATMRENVALSRLAGGGQDVEAAARAAGADAAAGRVPHGYDTLLGRWFAGGTELSVGEWQRVALARAFYRAAPIVMLDEPTGAMDSWAENDWMERFRALVRGRTALIITHRFTTAMRADVVHVMHEGRIVESGTHRELIVRGGRYAESWEAQMRAARGGPK